MERYGLTVVAGPQDDWEGVEATTAEKACGLLIDTLELPKIHFNRPTFCI
jgi:hypothetical protein